MLNGSMFKKPAAEYLIFPFWFWNGEMEEEQIRLQIVEMAEKGLGGFFLSARQGMTVPYLSDSWFEKVKFAIEIAAQHGLHVWLYDEYPYPSGIAGGEVILEHPDAKHCTLEYRTAMAEGGQPAELELPWGRTVSAAAVPIDPSSGARLWDKQIDISSSIGNIQAEPVFQKTGLTDYNSKRFFSYGPIKKLRWKAPAGKWEIHVYLEAEIEDYKYYGTFVDFGHEEAVRTFIKLTHDRYKAAAGAYFGETVKGMFTDETGYLGKIPWSSKLPERFAAKHGYDIKEHLHALVDSGYADAAKIRYDLFAAANDLLRESYHKQCSDWCQENGLDYVAEVPAVRMTTQLYSHVIGSDSAHEKLGRSLEWIIGKYYSNFRSNPKMTSSLARQLGVERILCECFHSVGWTMTLQDSKWMIDRMAAMGINFYNFHSFFYTLDGLAKHDAPPSQFLQAPYWPYFGELSEYTGRISYIMTQGRAVNDIAVLDPTTSLWTHLGNPIQATAKGFQYIGKDEHESLRLKQLVKHWEQIGTELLLSQRDYDHLDTELLGRAEVRNGKVVLGSAEYSVLIIPPVSNLEADAWKTVNQFVQDGGTVIAAGLLPYEAIEADSPSEEEAAALFGLTGSYKELYWQGEAGAADSLISSPWIKGERNAYFLPPSLQGKEDLGQRVSSLLDELLTPSVRLGVGQAPRCFLRQIRATGSGYVIFVSNQEGKQHELPLYVSKDLDLVREDTGDIGIRRLNLETGEYEAVLWHKTGDGWTVPLSFAPYESHLIEIGRFPDTETGAVALEKQRKLELDAAGDWEVTADRPNVIRFDSFELSLRSEQGTPLAAGKIEVKTFIDQCADLAGKEQANIPVDFKQLFGTPKKMSVHYPVRCSYTTEFIVEQLPGNCSLFMDKSAISGEYTIWINDKQVEPSSFETRFVYDQDNMASPVLPFLQNGVNRITVELTASRDWDGVIDALYIEGDFGVRFLGQQIPVITKPVTNAALTGGPCPGYPYYAGALTYKRTFDLAAEDVPSFELQFRNWDPHFHDCAEVFINGKPVGVRAWTPYRWTGDSSILRKGTNTVEIITVNSLGSLLDGRYFDYTTHELIDVKTLTF